MFQYCFNVMSLAAQGWMPSACLDLFSEPASPLYSLLQGSRTGLWCYIGTGGFLVCSAKMEIKTKFSVGEEIKMRFFFLIHPHYQCGDGHSCPLQQKHQLFSSLGYFQNKLCCISQKCQLEESISEMISCSLELLTPATGDLAYFQSPFSISSRSQSYPSLMLSLYIAFTGLEFSIQIRLASKVKQLWRNLAF